MSVSSDLSVYRTTSIFRADTVPQALLAAHRTRSGVHARLVVVSGRVMLHRPDSSRAPEVVDPERGTMIEPEELHFVEMDEGAAFFLEFMRPCPESPPEQENADADGEARALWWHKPRDQEGGSPRTGGDALPAA